MNVPGATFLLYFSRSSCNLDSRLSEMRATKRTNQTFSFATTRTSERTYAHDQKNNLYISALQRVDQVACKHKKRKKTVRYVCLSVDAASNRTCTFIVVPYV